MDPQHAKQYARVLHENGVVVFPVVHGARLASMHRAFMDLDFVEYLDFERPDPGLKRANGGLGMYGHPSSFHHPTVRKWRRQVHSAVMPLFAAYEHEQAKIFEDYQVRNLETLFERLSLRKKSFGITSAESLHRDVFPGTPDLPKNDELLGGWLNLDLPDSRNQVLVIAKGTHLDNVRRANRMQRLNSEAIAKYREQVYTQRKSDEFGCATDAEGRVVVPPGHAVVFFRRAVHSMQDLKPATVPTIRMFLGFRLTLAPVGDNLFANTDRVVEDFDVPTLPDGRKPNMYSRMHYSNWVQLGDWADSVFRKRVLFTRVSTTGKEYHTPGDPTNTNKTANVKRFMLSLKEYGLDGYYEPYANRDKAIMRACALKVYDDESPPTLSHASAWLPESTAGKRSRHASMVRRKKVAVAGSNYSNFDISLGSSSDGTLYTKKPKRQKKAKATFMESVQSFFSW